MDQSPSTDATNPVPSNSNHAKPIRVWPPLVFIILAIAVRLLPSQLPDGPSILPFLGAMAPIVAGLLILLWWLFASRAPWSERILGLVGMGLAGSVTFLAYHPSMQSPATMLLLTVPMGVAGFAGAVILTRKSSPRFRTRFAFTVSLLAFAFSLLLRSGGMWGDAKMDLSWRWVESAEERLVNSGDSLFAPSSESESASDRAQASEVSPELPSWPGFRGKGRNSRYSGPAIDPNWEQSPPELLWKKPIGPGWSSFALAGKHLYTQEQRGPLEMVVCYDALTGTPVWRQSLEARFSDPLGGPGPRATPTLAGEHLYALGADGDLSCLSLIDGSIVWHHNIGELAQRKAPEWGFSSSPLVVGEHVIVHAGGNANFGTLAFNAKTGDFAWGAPAGDHSYGSPQLVEIDNSPIVIMLTNQGFRCLDPANGTVLLSYEWKQGGYRALQPQLVAEDRLLVTSEMNNGARLFEFSRQNDALQLNEIWTSRSLKSDFNDFVVFENNAFGFDGGIFASIDLTTGKRNWKGGRYGNGQVLLLEQSGLLLVTSERGEGILLKATPEDLYETARVPLLKGKTWNHPVLADEHLYLRNGQEMACYRLALLAPEVKAPEN